MLGATSRERWCGRTLYKIALKMLASERRKQRGSVDSPDPAPEPSAPSTPESGFWVRKALAIDSADREILMLREYEQLSYGEIAELLRIPVNTVRSRLFRARMALRERLNPKPSLLTTPTGASDPATRAASAHGEA